jgi:hypothetical protein
VADKRGSCRQNVRGNGHILQKFRTLQDLLMHCGCSSRSFGSNSIRCILIYVALHVGKVVVTRTVFAVSVKACTLSLCPYEAFEQMGERDVAWASLTGS